MNSRERIGLALSHNEPDRIPFDMGGSLISGITGPAYEELLRFNGRSDDVVLAEIAYLTANPIDDFQIELGVDVLGAYQTGFTGFDLKMQEDERNYFYVDAWGTRLSKPKVGGIYYDFTGFPLKDADLDILNNYPFPNPKDEKMIKRTLDRVLEIINKGKCAMMGSTGYCPGLLQTMEFTMGFDEIFYRLGSDEDFVHRYVEILTQKDLEYWEMYFDLAEKPADVVIYADDFGTQEGLLISQAMFREYFKPSYTRIFSYIHKRAPETKILFHSCGGVYKLIPDLIETGIDILNPLQFVCKGMNLKEIKRTFGNDVALWGGGIDTQGVLPFGSVQEVRDSVKSTIDILAPGGGFVFNTVHTIQPGVPPENIMAMIETLMEYGKYK